MYLAIYLKIPSSRKVHKDETPALTNQPSGLRDCSSAVALVLGQGSLLLLSAQLQEGCLGSINSVAAKSMHDFGTEGLRRRVWYCCERCLPLQLPQLLEECC